MQNYDFMMIYYEGCNPSIILN